MKRIVEYSRTLPAFQLDLARLQLLASEVASQFDPEERVAITVSLKGEKLKFNSFEELESYEAKLPNRVLQFEVMWWGSLDCFCSLSKWGIIGCVGTIYATGNNTAWCAGVVAVVEKNVRENRRWYWFLRSWHFWLLGLGVLLLPTVGRLAGRQPFPREPVQVFAWLALWILFTALHVSFTRFFPPMTLTIRRDESWLKRHSTELTLVLSVASLVASLVALFRH